VQADVGVVDLERVYGVDDEVRRVGHEVAVDPYLNFAVVLADRIQPDHLLVAVPAVALRQEVRARHEVGVRGWIGLPREAAAVRIPVVAVAAALLRPVGVLVQPAG
jgi:hypothetical protein